MNIFDQILTFLRSNWVPVALCAIALGGLGSASLLHGNVMSLFDEWGYLDYLFKIPTQGMVFKGETYSDSALQLMACNGEVPFGVMGSACGATYSPSAFPNSGVVTADPNTPLYFVTVWLSGWIFKVIPGISQIAQWRLGNLLWLCVGIIIFYSLARFWKLNKIAIFAIGILVIGSPFAYWSYTYVSTDAPSFFFGALLLLLVSRFAANSGRMLPILVISVVATLFKVTNILAVLTALFVLVLLHLHQRRVNHKKIWPPSELTLRPSTIRVISVVALSLAFSTMAEFSWLLIHNALAVSDATVEQNVGSQLTWYELLRLTALPSETLGMTFPVNGLPGLTSIPLPDYALTPLSWILMGGVLASFWAMRPGTQSRAISVAAITGSLVAAPVLAVALKIATGEYFVLPPRYMASVLAVQLVAVGLTMRNRIALWLIASYGFLMLCALIVASLLISHSHLGASS
jgi:hypothetical protein